MENVVEFETNKLALTAAHFLLQSYKITMDFYISITYKIMYTDINNTGLSTIKLGYHIIQTIVLCTSSTHMD